MVCLLSGLTFIQTVSTTSIIIKNTFFFRATETGLKAYFSVRCI